MKKITLLLLMLISGTVFGQATTATASAEIITALKIEKVTDLNLGTIAPDADVATTFVLTPAGLTTGSTATDMDATGRSAASFTITGEDGETFSLTIPASVTLTGGSGTDMTLTLSHDLAASGNGFSSGSATLNVGGSLALAANQGSGTYSSTINVSVAYE